MSGRRQIVDELVLPVQICRDCNGSTIVTDRERGTYKKYKRACNTCSGTGSVYRVRFAYGAEIYPATLHGADHASQSAELDLYSGCSRYYVDANAAHSAVRARGGKAYWRGKEGVFCSTMGD